MALYSAEFSIAGVNSADAVLFNLKTAATDRAILREVFFGIEVAPTNAPQFGLKRMNAVGTGAITLATVFSHDTADGTASTGLETAWATTRPTVTGGSARRGQVPLAIGNGFLFDFTNRGIIVPVSAGLCGVMRNASGATTGTLGGYVTWEE
jgi:hypothetical protein